MTKPKKYLISVVPIIKIPLNRDQFFYYTHDKKIPNGSLVEISFGRRKLQGIVIDSKSDFKRLGNIRLKKITDVVEEKFLTEDQIEIASFISEYYIASLGIVMKSFIPKKVKARKSKEKSRKSKVKKNIKSTKEQMVAVNRITKKPGTFLLYGPASSGKTQIYLEAIKKLTSAKDSQALILLPELTSVAQEVERYGAFFGDDNVAVLHSKISKGKFYENWQSIKSGKTKIIIGTRQTVFAPFKNLKIIVIDEEQDPSFKQWDRHPRYDSRTVAEKLSEIHKSRLVFGSATPSIETYCRATQKEIQLLKIPELQSPKRQIEIVDMRKERWKKNYSPISRRLASEIEWNLKNKFQIILFISRQGMSNFSVCKSCKTVLSCPKCERALVYQKKGYYKCAHCDYKTSIFPTCKKCGSAEFQNIGLGTQRIEKELEKTFSSAKITRADSDSMKSSIKSQTKLWQDFSQGKIDILIGTQMITKNWDLKNVGLVSIIDADSLFNFPDYSTNQRAFESIVQTIGRTGRTNSKISGKAIIQTFRPENEILKNTVELSFEKFYKKEIESRKDLSYPPFTHLIKLAFQDKDNDFVKKETEAVYKKIISDVDQNRNLKIYPPQKMLVSNIRGRHRRQIVIKVRNYPKIQKKLLKVIQSLGKGWFIDVDPISLV